MSFNPATARNGPLNAIMFSVGVLVVFIGVFLLTKSGHSNPAEEHKEEDTVKVSASAQDYNTMQHLPSHFLPLLLSCIMSEICTTSIVHHTWAVGH
ncbi:hypothetical protein HaLaN_08713 [Haematococcus lacustris]|uniref:Uncharacterized protein n=1 Tax=Haematococcus lacustris TaxID=44745 RepID=A0A699YTJ4_HAELA|nr:hypothetical protein HaLaN_08713 [Haematococcus lacustris]